MGNLTAMQELIGYLKRNARFLSGENNCEEDKCAGIAYTDAAMEAERLLEKEKQQMKVIYFDPISGVDEDDFETYYNDTYPNK